MYSHSHKIHGIIYLNWIFCRVICGVNVGKYTIHGLYGIVCHTNPFKSWLRRSRLWSLTECCTGCGHSCQCRWSRTLPAGEQCSKSMSHNPSVFCSKWPYDASWTANKSSCGCGWQAAASVAQSSPSFATQNSSANGCQQEPGNSGLSCRIGAFGSFYDVIYCRCFIFLWYSMI